MGGGAQRRRGRPALESDGGYGAIVREARKGKGVSLAGFSLRVGVSVSHLSRIERGRAHPSLDVHRRLMRALGLRPEKTISLLS